MGQNFDRVECLPQPRQRASRAVSLLSAGVPALAAAAAIALALSVHGSAHAQAVSSGDPCGIVRRDLAAEKSRDQVSATNVSQQGARVIENAKRCLDRVRRVAGGVAMPQARIYEATIDSITSYLMNQACQIFVSSAEGAINEVNGTVAPYVNVLSRYENAINGNIAVQDVISGGGIGGSGLGGTTTTIPTTGGLGGITGNSGLGRVVTRGVQDVLPGYTPPAPTQGVQAAPNTAATAPQPSRSVIDRISCAMGFGGQCR